MRTSFAFLTAVLLLGVSPRALAQPLNVNTLAGLAGRGSADGVTAGARFANPWGVAVDGAGNVYVADTDNHTIRKVTPAGVVSTLAGLAGISGSSDGTGTNALFYQPQGIAVDSATNLYVADTGNHIIRKITPAGVVSTLAGSAGQTGSTNATGANARFYEPEGIAVSSNGSLIYVADTWNHLIRQLTAGGAVTTLAGSASTSGTNNGTGTGAQFNDPQGIAVDGDGTVYVGDTGNQAIRKITAAGVVTTYAGSIGNSGTNNGTGTARFWDPQGVTLDGLTNLYVADSFNNTIRKVTPGGLVTTIAGTAGTFGSADATGSAARFWQPQGVAADASGNVYVADSANGTIRKIVSGSVVSTLAGAASIGSADGTGSSARFTGPSGAVIDNSGNGYIADTGNGTIRQVSSAGVVTTLAGSAGNFGTNDGTGGSARFNGPQGVALNAGASLVYVADTANHTIRKITSGGAVSTLAGVGGTNGTTDGSGASARFNFPQGAAVDSSGNVYVADSWNHTIRKVTASGVVSTLAGVPGSFGDLDSNAAGAGTNGARFYCPSALAVDGSGNVYVADTRNHVIRKVTAGGAVSTLAGLGGVWGSADGVNNGARFFKPTGISVDGSGNLLVVDSGNGTIRKLTVSGTNCVVTTVAGAAGILGSVDGVGPAAHFFFPAGISLNSSNAFFIADSGNNTIRSGTVITNTIPIIFTQPAGLSVTVGATASFSVTAGSMTQVYYQWLFSGGAIPGATSSSFTRTNVQIGDVGPYSVVVSNLVGSVISSNALLTLVGPPSIAIQPASQIVFGGQAVVFSVLASGTQPLSYQWKFDGNNIAGATDSAVNLGSVGDENNGTYSVIITNGEGVAVSSNALLTVTAMSLWGDNSLGQLNVPSDPTNVIAISAGAWHNLALRGNGTMFAWGNDSDGECDVPAALADVLAIAAGGYHSLALRASGSVLAWGSNDHGQTNVPPTASNVIGLSAGTWHSLALRRDGTVVAWGDDGWGQSDVPPGLSNVIAVAAGGNHSLALKANGTLAAWGENTDADGNPSGQSTVPLDLTNVIMIAAGKYHSLAVRTDGTVMVWGDNSQGQCSVPVGLSNVVALAGGGSHTLALLSDGTVLAWGANWVGQSTVPGPLANVVAVSAGENHSMALAGGNLPTPLLLNPVLKGGKFSVLLQTLYRRNYALDYRNSLAPGAWTSVFTNGGNGALRQLIDPSATGSQRYYRMREW